ncbi:MAG: hypothetical protein PVJ24_07300 [Methyloceanibacter sp.]
MFQKQLEVAHDVRPPSPNVRSVLAPAWMLPHLSLAAVLRSMPGAAAFFWRVPAAPMRQRTGAAAFFGEYLPHQCASEADRSFSFAETEE